MTWDVTANLAPLRKNLAVAKSEVALAGNSIASSSGVKNLEKDVTGLGKSAAGGIPILGSLGSSIGGLPLPALAAAAALGGLVIAGKSMVEISDRWEAAQAGLKQATTATGGNYAEARSEVDKFIASNRRFIPNQAEVVDSFAALTRQLGPTGRVTQDLNLALDLAAIKHISLKDATTALQQAEAGRGRALLTLGIQMKDYPVLMESQHQADVKLEAAEKAVEKATLAHTAAVKAHGPHSAQAQSAAVALAAANVKLAEAHNYAKDRATASAEIHDLLEKKLKGGRETTESLQQSMNQLGNVWQTLSERAGPGVTKILAFMIDQFTALVGLISDAVGKVMDLIDWLGKIKLPSISLPFGIGGPSRDSTHRALGGDALPGRTYTVGESGTETLVMGQQGGYIIPHGGGRAAAPIHIHMDGIYAGDGPSLDILANKIALRLGYATGR